MACPRAPRDEKNRGKKQTDPRGKDKNEKQHKLHMKSIYISV